MSPDADVSRIVRDAQAGWQAWGADELTDLLQWLHRNPDEARQAGQRARELFERQFTRSVVTARYAEIVADLAPTEGPSLS
jgi:glycosyltransferase involved in cell wall biosynthesis